MTAERLTTLYILHVISYCGRVVFLEYHVFLVFCGFDYSMTRVKEGKFSCYFVKMLVLFHLHFHIFEVPVFCGSNCDLFISPHPVGAVKQ